MTASTRHRALAAASLVAALLAAIVLGDTFRRAAVGDLRAGSFAIVSAAALAAMFGFLTARVRGAVPGRISAAAALVAALLTFLLLRFPSPWVDFGPFGAGPLTATALVVFPLAQLGAIVSVMRWTAR